MNTIQEIIYWARVAGLVLGIASFFGLVPLVVTVLVLAIASAAQAVHTKSGGGMTIAPPAEPKP